MLVDKLPRDTVARLGSDFSARYGAEENWPDDEVRAAVCRLHNIPVVPVSAAAVDMEAFEQLHPLCLPLQFLPTFKHGIALCVVSPEPFSRSLVRELRRKTNLEIRLLGCSESDFDRAIAECEARLATVKAARRASFVPRVTLPAEAWNVDARAMGQTVREIVENAWRTGAGDIQIEPQEEMVRVRFLYGATWEVMPPIELKYRDSLVKAFREAAGLSSISPTPFNPGKARFNFEGDKIDVRIEIAPFTWGEGVSCRILEPNQGGRAKKIPLADADNEIIAQCCAQKQGIVLVVGPTGSGKSTTLYDFLNRIDRDDKNVRTVEDPPEFDIRRAMQIEVGERVNRTFAQALKSLLRQKPDVILIGEIRDDEVADIAVKAGLTGILVFASLHANDSTGAIPRLLEMNVKPFVLQSTLMLVVAQRLVDVLCDNCKATEPVTRIIEDHFAMHGLEAPRHTCRKVGCHQCANRGIVGKVAIYELFYPSGELRAMISHEVSADTLRQHWIRAGGVSMIKNGLQLVAQGRVQWEEVRAYDNQPIRRQEGRASVPSAT